MTHPISVVLMGVSGSGKTTVGERAAAELGWQFLDADDYHPPENIKKMSNGIPLTDEDRWPWLKDVHEAMVTADRPTIMACSALKESYRDVLRSGLDTIHIIYLKGSYDLIHERMTKRDDHFFDADMLRSQFEALEEPTPDENVITVSVRGTIEEVTNAVVKTCERLQQHH